MPTAYYIAPYRLDRVLPWPVRSCAIERFGTRIRAEGGRWAAIEILPKKIHRYGTALVKVTAPPHLLSDLDAAFPRVSSSSEARAEVSAKIPQSRYDAQTDRFVYDGPMRTAKTFEVLERSVS